MEALVADLAGSPEKQAQPQCCGLTTAQEVGLAEAPVVALAGGLEEQVQLLRHGLAAVQKTGLSEAQVVAPTKGLEQQARLLWCRLTAAQVVGLAEAPEQQAQLLRRGLTTQSAQKAGLSEALVVAPTEGLEQQARLLWCRLAAARVVGLAEALEQQAQLPRRARGLTVARTAPAEQQSRAGRLLQPRADAESGPIPPRTLV